MTRRGTWACVVGVGGGCAATMADAMSAGLSSAAVWLLCSYCGGSAAGVGWLFDCALAAPTAGHGRCRVSDAQIRDFGALLAWI